MLIVPEAAPKAAFGKMSQTSRTNKDNIVNTPLSSWGINFTRNSEANLLDIIPLLIVSPICPIIWPPFFPAFDLRFHKQIIFKLYNKKDDTCCQYIFRILKVCIKSKLKKSHLA